MSAKESTELIFIYNLFFFEDDVASVAKREPIYDYFNSPISHLGNKTYLTWRYYSGKFSCRGLSPELCLNSVFFWVIYWLLLTSVLICRYRSFGLRNQVTGFFVLGNFDYFQTILVSVEQAASIHLLTFGALNLQVWSVQVQVE